MIKKIISTTLYVQTDNIEKIKTVSKKLKIPKKEIISILLRNMADKHDLHFKIFRSVMYQDKKPRIFWKRFHVEFDCIDYELFSDLRKLFKMSVSLLLAKAIDEFLDDLMVDDGLKDNYQINSYTISRKFTKDHLIWQIHWPKQLDRRKNTPN